MLRTCRGASGGGGGMGCCEYAHDEALTSTGWPRTWHRSASTSRVLSSYQRNFHLCPDVRRRPAVMRPCGEVETVWVQPQSFDDGRQPESRSSQLTGGPQSIDWGNRVVHMDLRFADSTAVPGSLGESTALLYSLSGLSPSACSLIMPKTEQFFW